MNQPETPSLTLLNLAGDPLERAIVQEPALSRLLIPYAEVWAMHVYPRRDPETFVQANWLPFASAHYTALVRCFNAYRNWELVEGVCCEATECSVDGELLLAFHGWAASFWEHMGAAIDNLGHCFVWSIPQLSKDGTGYLTKKVSRDLDFIFYRRTQYIHHPLVPVGIRNGLLQFNSVLHEDESTKWIVRSFEPQAVRSYYEQSWSQFINGMERSWAELRGKLGGDHVQRPAYDIQTAIATADSARVQVGLSGINPDPSGYAG